MSVSQALGEAREVLCDLGTENNSAGGHDVSLNQVAAFIAKMDSKISGMDNRLRAIESQVNKIDDIQSSLNSLTFKVKKLEGEVMAIKKKSSELEQSTQAISDFYDDVKKKTEMNKSDICGRKKQIETAKVGTKQFDSQCEMLKKENEGLRAAVEDLQCGSMKNNLVFTGLLEQQYEDTELKLRDFISEELGIERYNEFGNVQKHVPGKRRPIVARLLYHRDWQEVKDSAYRLRVTQYGINEQFPVAIEDRKKKLYPVMKQYKAVGYRVKMVRDKLYINGKLYLPHRENSTTESTHQKNCSDQTRLYSDVARTSSVSGRPAKRPRAPSTPSCDPPNRYMDINVSRMDDSHGDPSAVLQVSDTPTSGRRLPTTLDNNFRRTDPYTSGPTTHSSDPDRSRAPQETGSYSGYRRHKHTSGYRTPEY